MVRKLNFEIVAQSACPKCCMFGVALSEVYFIHWNFEGKEGIFLAWVQGFFLQSSLPSTPLTLHDISKCQHVMSVTEKKKRANSESSRIGKSSSLNCWNSTLEQTAICNSKGPDSDYASELFSTAMVLKPYPSSIRWSDGTITLQVVQL